MASDQQTDKAENVINSETNTQKKTSYKDVMGKENFRKWSQMSRNFHLYPNYPDLLLVGKYLNDSTTLTPLDEQTEYYATVIDMKPSSTVVRTNPNYDEGLNNYQLTRQYKEDYPGFGLTIGNLSGAVSSQLTHHNDVQTRNTSIGAGLVGLIVGSIFGNAKYDNAMKKSMSENYKTVNTTFIYFKINDPKLVKNTGRFSQTNENLLKSGNWKIGDTIRFYKENHIWMFEKK